MFWSENTNRNFADWKTSQGIFKTSKTQNCRNRIGIKTLKSLTKLDDG